MAVIDIIKSNVDARREIQKELRSIDESCTSESRGYTDDESAKIGEFRSQLEAIDERISSNLAMEVRSQEIEDGMGRFLGVLADRDRGDDIDNRSLGQRFAESDEFRSFADSSANVSGLFTASGVDFRSVTDVTFTSTSGGAFVQNTRLDRIGSDFLARRVFLADVLPVIPVDGVVEYVQDKTALADQADIPAEVAEGGSKPQAGLTTAVITESPATIPAWVNMTRRTARRAPQVQAYLDGRLRYALKRRFDKQAINGDGSSPNLKGLLQRTGILTQAPGSSEERAKTIRKAITTMELSETVPEIVVLNPSDHELVDLVNFSSAGLNAVPNIAAPPSGTAWGLQVVKSTAIAAGTAMLIDPMSVAVLDEAAPRAYLTDSHGTNFTSNVLTLLLELDAGLALFDPAGVCKVTFHD